MLAGIKAWARRLRGDIVAVYFAARDPDTPYWLRLLALLVAAYALSPIDLIPDFIPVIGYLDDLLLVPLGLLLILRWLPAPVLERARTRASAALDRPRSQTAGVFIVCLWIALALWMARWLGWFDR